MSEIKVDTRLIERGFASMERLLGNNIRNKRPVFLGNPIDGSMYADINETLVYVHGLGSEPSSITRIPSSNISKEHLIFKKPILIEQLANGDWSFADIDVEADAKFSAGITAIPDQTPVKLSQLDYGTLHPYSGLVLLAKGAMYGNDYVVDTLTGDFATGTVQDTSAANIVVPTTNNKAIAIMIQVTPSTGVLSYKQSAEFLATTSLQSQFIAGALSTPDGTAYRIGYVKLVKGVSSVSYSHIWVVPELLSKGDGAFPITLDYTKTIVSNSQIVTSDFTINSGSLTIDGRITVI